MTLPRKPGRSAMKSANDDTRQSSDKPTGYKSPPKSGQFKPGQSGNPRGRPKGAKAVEAIFWEEANRKVKVRRDNKTVSVTKLQAVVAQTFHGALSGDRHARDIILKEAKQKRSRSQEIDPADIDLSMLTDEELEAYGAIASKVALHNPKLRADDD